MNEPEPRDWSDFDFDLVAQRIGEAVVTLAVFAFLLALAMD